MDQTEGWIDQNPNRQVPSYDDAILSKNSVGVYQSIPTADRKVREIGLPTGKHYIVFGIGVFDYQGSRFDKDGIDLSIGSAQKLEIREEKIQTDYHQKDGKERLIKTGIKFEKEFQK